MRKIEQQMNDAVANNKNWQSANTSVHYNEENGVSIVRLHGNKIAEIGDDYLQIFDGGWQTTTTKSRLNALIDRFCNAVTDGVFQKDYQWYVRDNNVTKDFESGYIFAWRNHPEETNTFLFLITSFFITMQVTNSATIVDYFPEAFIAEGHPIKGMIVTIKRFNKRVTFRANGMKSYSTIVATDARNEWESRIAKGATVTNFNTDKMPRSEYMPLMCWLCLFSLILPTPNWCKPQPTLWTKIN